MGNRTCGPDNAQGVVPGWYGDDDCWPGAIWCPDIAGPYDPAIVHPGMLKPHTWTDEQTDIGPSYLASGIDAWDAGSYVGGYN